MNLSTFSERLNLCLDKEGFPPKHCGRIQLLAEMIGLTHRGASKWVNGQSTPPAKKYASLAQKLNVSEEWLASGKGSMLGNEPSKRLSLVNGLIQEVVIFNMNELLLTQPNNATSMPCVLPYKGNFFGITLETEAMSPRFPNGSIIIFDKESCPKDGDFVLVQTQGLPEIIFRQLLITNDARYLCAGNPKFDQITWSNDYQILGKLAQAIVSFE